MARSPYDPAAMARAVERSVVEAGRRRYYRIRGARWYGGIATADCLGCNLDCAFCWSQTPKARASPGGRLYSPREVFDALCRSARRGGYGQLRVSGNEPTIGREHLLELLGLVDRTEYAFILETNGTLIDRGYALDLARFRNLHVRVCLKGTCEEEFSRLTGARPEGFLLQLQALEHLVAAGASVHAAVMLSFASAATRKALGARLGGIHPALAASLEEEFIFLYPHVKKRLEGSGLRPRTAYSPGGVPEELA